MDHSDMSFDKVEESFRKTLLSDHLKDLTLDIGEALLDPHIGDEIVKNIPVLGGFYKALKIYNGFRDYFFITKCHKFLIGIKECDKSKIQDFIIELEEKRGQKAGEVLMMLIDRLDDIQKPTIISKLFIARLNNQITLEKFLRLSAIVATGFYFDLIKLPSIEKEENVDAE